MAGIGELVVNLGANASGLVAGTNKAKGILSGFAGSVAGILGPAVAAVGGIFAVKSSVSAFKTQLQAEQKLAAVLEATGNAAGLSAKEIAAYASELQGATNYGDELTIANAAVLATFQNIKGDNFKEVLALSQDLATVLGKNVNEVTKQLGKSLNDPVKGLEQLREVGISFTESEKNRIKALQESGNLLGAQEAILSKLQGTYGGAASKLADPWVQMGNAIGDVSEMFGSLLLPTINVAAGAVGGFASYLSGYADMFRSIGVEVAVFFSHMGGLLDLSVKQWSLWGVGLGEDVKYWFTNALPQYISWFGSNFSNMLTTIGDFAGTVFANLVYNIENAWKALMDYLSGNPVQFDWTPLTEGFQNSISELPDIPKRLTTEFEKGLKRDIDATATNLTASMEQQRAKLESVYKPVDVPTPTEIEDVAQGAEAATKNQGQKFSGALQKGSAEAYSAIIQAMGAGKDPQVKATDKLTKVIEDKVAKPLGQLVFRGGNLQVVESF